MIFVSSFSKQQKARSIFGACTWISHDQREQLLNSAMTDGRTIDCRLLEAISDLQHLGHFCVFILSSHMQTIFHQQLLLTSLLYLISILMWAIFFYNHISKLRHCTRCQVQYNRIITIYQRLSRLCWPANLSAVEYTLIKKRRILKQKQCDRFITCVWWSRPCLDVEYIMCTDWSRQSRSNLR